MNKFQAKAQIVEILCEDGFLQKGSHRYKIARKLIATKINTMGPDVAYSQAKWSKYTLLVEIKELQNYDGKTPLDFTMSPLLSTF